MKGKTIKRASGGSVPMKVSGNPNVFKEAAARKKGGAVKGKMAMSGGLSRHRLDRPGRKAGGRVGANKSPLSTAHAVVSAESTPKTQVGGAS